MVSANDKKMPNGILEEQGKGAPGWGWAEACLPRSLTFQREAPPALRLPSGVTWHHAVFYNQRLPLSERSSFSLQCKTDL